MNESVSRILGTIFSRELAAQCTWDGNDGLKIKDLFVIKKIEGSIVIITLNYNWTCISLFNIIIFTIF